MRNQSIMHFESKNVTPKKHPNFRPGDTIKVHYKIEETAKAGAKEKKFRIQAFEGVCLRFKKGATAIAYSSNRILNLDQIFNRCCVPRPINLSVPDPTSQFSQKQIR